MSAPLPNALRARFQRLIEEGFSGRGGVALEAFTGPWGTLEPYDPANWTGLSCSTGAASRQEQARSASRPSDRTY